MSDIKMPLMDGITLTCSVRAEFPAIAVILVSGYAEIEQAKLPNSGFEFVPASVSSGHTSLSSVKRVMRSKSTLIIWTEMAACFSRFGKGC